MTKTIEHLSRELLKVKYTRRDDRVVPDLLVTNQIINTTYIDFFTRSRGDHRMQCRTLSRKWVCILKSLIFHYFTKLFSLKSKPLPPRDFWRGRTAIPLKVKFSYQKEKPTNQDGGLFFFLRKKLSTLFFVMYNLISSQLAFVQNFTQS